MRINQDQFKTIPQNIGNKKKRILLLRGESKNVLVNLDNVDFITIEEVKNEKI
jgi:hypothetical protein